MTMGSGSGMFVAGREWSVRPFMTLTGGSNGLELRPLWDKGFHLATTSNREPLVLECSGSETQPLFAEDSQQIWDLFVDRSTFSLVAPGVMPNGGSLVAAKAAILNAPKFRYRVVNNGQYRVTVDYSFSITVVDDPFPPES